MIKKNLKVSTRLQLGAFALVIAFFSAVLHYNLPRTSVVQVIGTDVKRMDEKGQIRQGEKGQESLEIVSVRDVRFINAVDDSGKTLVFRNEDTGWGFPPYLKFNSADITAQAQTFSTSSEKPWVLVKYYGWRIRMLDAFPNVISMRQVSKDYSRFPWFNTLFLMVLAAAGTYVGLKIRNVWKRIAGRFRKRDSHRKG